MSTAMTLVAPSSWAMPIGRLAAAPPSINFRPSSCTGGNMPAIDMLARMAVARLPRSRMTALPLARSAATARYGIGSRSKSVSPVARISSRPCISSRTLRTPTGAAPRAPPPLSTSARCGRGAGAAADSGAAPTPDAASAGSADSTVAQDAAARSPMASAGVRREAQDRTARLTKSNLLLRTRTIVVLLDSLHLTLAVVAVGRLVAAADRGVLLRADVRHLYADPLQIRAAASTLHVAPQ